MEKSFLMKITSKIDTNEIAFNINSNHAKIPICLYANRVKIKKEKKKIEMPHISQMMI